MLDPRKIAEIEQATAFMVEVFPKTMKQLYDALIEEGFAEQQAMQLVIVWFQTIMSVKDN